MDYLGEHIRTRAQARRFRPLARGVHEPGETLEDRIPRWILAGLLMLLAVQLAIAL